MRPKDQLRGAESMARLTRAHCGVVGVRLTAGNSDCGAPCTGKNSCSISKAMQSYFQFLSGGTAQGSSVLGRFYLQVCAKRLQAARHRGVGMGRRAEPRWGGHCQCKWRVEPAHRKHFEEVTGLGDGQETLFQFSYPCRSPSVMLLTYRKALCRPISKVNWLPWYPALCQGHKDQMESSPHTFVLHPRIMH